MPKKYLTDERKSELVQIAKDMHAGRIFTDRHCNSLREIQSVFAVLMLMNPADLKKLAKRVGKTGIMYEYVDKAGPVHVNGLPMFFSMRHLTDTEGEYTLAKLKEIEAVMDAVGEGNND